MPRIWSAPRTFLDAYIATYKQTDSKPMANRGAPAWFGAWTKKFKWEERAAASDAFIASKREAADVKGTEREAIKWAVEREELRRRELEQGNAMCDQVMQMLSRLPMDPEATLQPRDLASMATALMKGAQLIRQAAEYPVAKEVRISGSDGGEVEQKLTVIVKCEDPEPCGHSCDPRSE